MTANMVVSILVIALGLYIFFPCESEAQNLYNLIGRDCTMEDEKGSQGTTKYLRDCQAAVSNLRAGIEPTLVAQVKTVAVVCCPTGKRISAIKCEQYAQVLIEIPPRPLLPTSAWHSATTLPPQIMKCEHKAVPYIVGGRDALLMEFPHMAAIGYGPNGQSGYKCGGTLISEKFVITASHCISGTNQPTVVLLGDISISKKVSRDRLIVKIGKIHQHPLRKSPLKYHDIALLELEKPVRLSKAIRPACLPQPEDRLENIQTMTAAGWGYTEALSGGSNMLQAVNLTRVNQKDCEKLLNEKIEKEILYPQGILRSQFCAGDPAGRNGTKDTCKGDSGGGLTVKTHKSPCIFYLMGITSFGSQYCEGDEPGVYTNVASFLDWIEKVVWPNQ